MGRVPQHGSPEGTIKLKSSFRERNSESPVEKDRVLGMAFSFLQQPSSSGQNKTEK